MCTIQTSLYGLVSLDQHSKYIHQLEGNQDMVKLVKYSNLCYLFVFDVAESIFVLL